MDKPENYESSIKKDSLESSFIQILKGILKVKSTNKKSKGNRIKKNELDYFEYTYISDSPC
jgi:hypothetical protein